MKNPKVAVCIQLRCAGSVSNCIQSNNKLLTLSVLLGWRVVYPVAPWQVSIVRRRHGWFAQVRDQKRMRRGPLRKDLQSVMLDRDTLSDPHSRRLFLLSCDKARCAHVCMYQMQRWLWFDAGSVGVHGCFVGCMLAGVRVCLV